MDGRYGTRRRFLGGLAGALALLGTGRWNRVLADKTLNNGDKATFEKSCKQYNGEFVDSPKDKLTLCVWSDGSRTVCDQNGNDCENYPPPKKPAGAVRNPLGGTVSAPLGKLSELTPADPAAGDALAPGNDGGKTKTRRHGKRRKK
jgi:hypothetical protein